MFSDSIKPLIFISYAHLDEPERPRARSVGCCRGGAPRRRRNNWLLSIALDTLTLGRADLALAL
jgi:hypothetical protein